MQSPLSDRDVVLDSQQEVALMASRGPFQLQPFCDFCAQPLIKQFSVFQLNLHQLLAFHGCWLFVGAEKPTGVPQVIGSVRLH